VGVLAWSGSGTLASGGTEGAIRVWNLGTGKAVRTLHEQPSVNSLAWSPDGRLLAGGANEDIARVYSAATGKVLHELEQAGSPRTVTGLAFSPDGNILASGRDNHTMQLWNVKTGKLVHGLATMAPVLAVTWPAGSSTVATATTDGAVRFWDSIPGRLRASLLLQNNRVFAVAAEGHYRAPAEAGEELVVVVQQERAQETLTPQEFAAQYAWKNNPTAVKLTGN
jgi:WD40 repeat protein